MPPVGGTKRKSNQSTMSTTEDQLAISTMSQKVPTKVGSPQTQESPFKKRRVGITLAQKQALIENLQLESMFTPQESPGRAAHDVCSHGTRPQASSKLQHPRTESSHSDRNSRQPHSLVFAQAHHGRALGEVFRGGATKTSRTNCRPQGPSRSCEGQGCLATTHHSRSWYCDSTKASQEAKVSRDVTCSIRYTNQVQQPRDDWRR